MTRAREIAYLERVLKFLDVPDDRPEYEKDIWNLENLSIPVRLNPIRNYRVINLVALNRETSNEKIDLAKTTMDSFIKIQKCAVNWIRPRKNRRVCLI